MNQEEMVRSMAEAIYMAAPCTTVTTDPLDNMPLYVIVPFSSLPDHVIETYRFRASWAIRKARDWEQEGVDVQSFQS